MNKQELDLLNIIKKEAYVNQETVIEKLLVIHLVK